MKTAGESPLGTSGTCLVLLFIVLVGAALRFYDIGADPLSISDGFSLWYADRSWTEIFSWIPSWDPHPPLHNTVLKVWTLLGQNEITIRSLSAIFGILTIPCIYFLGRTIGGPSDGAWIGLGAALLFAVSPLHIEFAREPRYPMMQTLIVAFTLCAAAWLMRNRWAACAPLLGFRTRLSQSGRHDLAAEDPWSARWAWMAVIAGATLSVWLHNVSVFFLASVALAMLIWLAGPLRWNRDFLTNSLLASLIVVLLWSPFLHILWAQSTSLTDQLWLQAPTLWDIAWQVRTWFGANHVHFTSLFVLGGAALAGTWWVARHSGWSYVFLLVGVAGGPIVLSLLISYTFKPIFFYRTMIWVTVPYFILVAAAACFLKRAWLRIALLAGLSAILLTGSVRFYSEHDNQPWDQIVGLIAKETEPRAVVFLLPAAIELPFAYNLQKLPLDVTTITLPGPFPALDFPNAYPTDVTAGPAIAQEDLVRVRELSAGQSPVWLVVWRRDLYDPEEILLNALLQERTLSLTKNFESNIDEISVYRFE